MKNFTKQTFYLLLLMSLGFASNSQAVVISATMDTYTDSRTPNNNYGSATLISLGQSATTPGTGHQDIYLFFDLSSLVPNGFSASNVTASLALRESDVGVNVLNLAAYPVNGTFSESTLTYNNSPGYNTSSAVFNSSTWIQGWNTFSGANLNALVTSWLNNSASNFGLAVVATGSVFTIDNSDNVFSKESVNQPALTVTFNTTAVSEPSTIALFGFGLSGLFFSRRKFFCSCA